jgi:hypothetical protein
MYTSVFVRSPPAGRGSAGSAALVATVTGREAVLGDEARGGLGDRHDAVGPVQQEALRPPRQVERPPPEPERPRELARRRAVPVVDEVVQGEHERVPAAP